jgi:hypothetical protein
VSRARILISCEFRILTLNDFTNLNRVSENRRMMTGYERDDLLHIMKTNRFVLQDMDTAQMSFTRQSNGENYEVAILVIEDLPSVTIKQNGKIKHSETPKSVDDLKIFLEERLYKYLGT